MKYKLQKQYRYKGYDYSQDGFYFVTICVKNREMFFGNVTGINRGTYIENAYVELSQIGKIALDYWLEIPNHFPFVILDEFIIMPNHIHGIIQIDRDRVGTQNLAFLRYENKLGPQSRNLSSIIRGFKIGVTKYANKNNIDFAWQSRFHDRIIRDDDELNQIRYYIIKNPEDWILDRNNSENLFM